ncbi:M15 family metallopeptidase [Grimontia kaedaensis]|uniref:M15 family metallopeptidase n=1 Tax=Grimontia kaedaensis TaxID=2872157 RepID=A0ABY4WRA3_9GAMM|nr:M15 family metallopeptidase [Grimontia kaedaensis]USH01099.1 M15 family metallopeptidase [Grimontia kaedaensis]
MSFRLGSRSRHRLEGLHPHLVQIVKHAITLSDIDFTVLEGLRSTRRQRQLVQQGASQTLRSRHLTGHAVDLGAWVGDELRWDWPLYHRIADAMKTAANELGIPLEWGGDWVRFPDGPHFQLPWHAYPLEVH